MPTVNARPPRPVATGRGGFAILNRAVNPLVRWLLRSRLHWLVSRRLTLISYTGRRSGRRYTIPVGYRIAGLQVTITVGSPDRKVWCRSLTGRGRRSSSVLAAAGEAVMASRPGLEIRRSFR
jgi:hypothetical protein